MPPMTQRPLRRLPVVLALAALSVVAALGAIAVVRHDESVSGPGGRAGRAGLPRERHEREWGRTRARGSRDGQRRTGRGVASWPRNVDAGSK